MDVGTKRRILMLHGYGQSAYEMSRMFASTMKECDKDLEFLFLDAPNVLTPIDLTNHDLNANTIVSPSQTSVQGCSVPTANPPYPGVARSWFKIDEVRRDSTAGIEQSLQLLKKTLEENRFEAIMGFSQGASMAELICDALQRPQLYPEFCENGKPPHPPLRYIVCVSGFLLRGPYRWWGTPSIKVFDVPSHLLIHTPVLHIIGKNDIVVARERSERIIAHSKYRRVEEHIGGHFVPTRPKWRKFFAEFFRNPFGEIESPSARSEDDSRPYVVGGTLPERTSTQSKKEIAKRLEAVQEDVIQPQKAGKIQISLDTTNLNRIEANKENVPDIRTHSPESDEPDSDEFMWTPPASPKVIAPSYQLFPSVRRLPSFSKILFG